jgi:hypothetical protein
VPCSLPYDESKELHAQRERSAGHGRPTRLPAGDPAKVAVLALRFELAQELFNPLDAVRELAGGLAPPARGKKQLDSRPRRPSELNRSAADRAKDRARKRADRKAKSAARRANVSKREGQGA